MCLVLAIAGGLDAAVARAGSYQVAICHDPATGATASFDGLSFPTLGPYAYGGFYAGCGAGGYVYATLDGAIAHGPNEFAAWKFQAPPGTTITSAQLWRAFSASSSSTTEQLEAISSSGAVNVLATCDQASGCSSAGTGPSSEFSAENLLEYSGLTGITALEGTAACGAGPCAAGGNIYCPELGGGDPCIATDYLYSLVVTLEDDSAPTTGNVTGTLVEPGVLAGEAEVSFDATDTGSGLYSAALAVDGITLANTQIDSNDGRCVPIDSPGSGGVPAGVLRFASSVPCALSGSATLEFDTNTLRDGSHSVVVTVTDGAGNTATVWSGTIETDNAPQGGVPQMSGDAQQGQTLLAGTGSWSPQPTGYSYQWERCDASDESCVAIPGATEPAYTLTAADAYGQVAVSVTASNAQGSTTATSAASGVVLDTDGYASRPEGPRLAAGSLPSLTGSAQQGDTLNAHTGEWSDTAATYSYQWERCNSGGLGCEPIVGAVGAAYTLGAADPYSRVRVLVSASAAGGTSVAASKTSALIADSNGSTVSPVNGSPPAAQPPVAGAPRVANGSGSCSDPRLSATLDGASSATIPVGRSVTLRGALHCGRTPIKDAVVDLEIASLAGAAPARSVQIRTTSDGSFAYVVGSGTSRRITASYRQFDGEARPSASAGAEVLVTPVISLAITPTHTLNRHTITFNGRVSGGHEPRDGLPLEIEYLEGTHWMIYDVVQANPDDGRFTYRYTFERTTQSITYTFRVAIPSTGVNGYPYQPTVSPARSVHVDP